MNKFKGITQSLRWFMAFLLVAFVAGCGGGSGGGVAPSHTKAITAYSLAVYPASVVTINEPLKTIQVVVPNGTPVTALKALVATFTSTGAGLPTVGGVNQVSGTTANDFTLPKPYIVTAADGTTATYTVTVSVALNSAKAITSYSLGGTAGAITGSASPFAIAVTVPNGTSLSGLIATFATTGNSVTVGTPAVTQTSGNTVNTFPASPRSLAYTVHAADGTTAIYNVTVTVAASAAKAITSFSFVGYPTSTGTITGAASPFAIAVTVPNTTSLTGLIATFVTTGSSVTVVATGTQVSGTTANTFPAAPTSLAYTVHAADTTTAIYNVTVTVAAAAGPVVCTGPGAGQSCVNLGAAANYAIFANTGIATDAGASIITGDIGTSPAVTSTAITGFAYSLPAASPFATSGQVSGKIYAYDFAPPTPTDVNTASLNMGAAYTAAAAMATAGGGLLVGGVGTACPGAGANGGALSDVNDAVSTQGNFPTTGLPAGVYTCGVGITIPGNLTLNGSSTDVWVFKTTGTLDESSAMNVTLTGGAKPQNVFWQVAGAVTIGTTAHFEGIILGQTSITFGHLSTIVGRPLAQAAVTLDATTVTQP